SNGAARGSGPARLFDIAVKGSAKLDKKTSDGQDFWDVRGALEVAHMVDLALRKGDMLSHSRAMVLPYEALDEHARKALGDGDDYCEEMLLASFRAASVATTREAFEGYLGLSSRGHGPLTGTIRGWYRERNNSDYFDDAPFPTWSEY